MNIEQMISALEEAKAKHGGNLTVAFWEYAGGLDDLHEAKLVIENDVALIVSDGSPALDSR